MGSLYEQGPSLRVYQKFYRCALAGALAVLLSVSATAYEGGAYDYGGGDPMPCGCETAYGSGASHCSCAPSCSCPATCSERQPCCQLPVCGCGGHRCGCDYGRCLPYWNPFTAIFDFFYNMPCVCGWNHYPAPTGGCCCPAACDQGCGCGCGWGEGHYRPCAPYESQPYQGPPHHDDGFDSPTSAPGDTPFPAPVPPSSTFDVSTIQYPSAQYFSPCGTSGRYGVDRSPRQLARPPRRLAPLPEEYRELRVSWEAPLPAQPQPRERVQPQPRERVQPQPQSERVQPQPQSEPRRNLGSSLRILGQRSQPPVLKSPAR